MTTKTEKALIKRWASCISAQIANDYTLAVLASETRALCKDDDEFTSWVETKLGLPRRYAAFDLLPRARMIAVGITEVQWTTMGGFKRLREVLRVPEGSRPAVFAAVVAGEPVRSAVAKHTPKTKPPVTVRGSAILDASKLAAYIARTGRNVPAEIAAIVARYTMRSTARLKIAA